MNYKTYAEAKIANPDSEIVTTGKDWGGGKDFIGTFEAVITGSIGRHVIDDISWVICNPADYCSSVKEFLESGFKFGEGDKFIGIDGVVVSVNNSNSSNIPNYSNANRYILSAAALNGGCKISSKADEWSAYNNTMPLCELTDEQAAMLFNAWRGDGNMQVLNDDEEWSDYNSGFYPLDVYRIKPKSERDLFIENTTKVMRDAGTKCPDNHEYFGIMFDAGARYKDLTQHFGENI